MTWSSQTAKHRLLDILDRRPRTIQGWFWINTIVLLSMREGIHLRENWFYVTVGLHAVIIPRYHLCAHIALIDKSPGLHWVLITLCPGLAWYRYLRCPLRSQLTSIERFQGFPGWRKGVHAVRIYPLGIINPTRVLTEVSREQCHQCVTHPRGITQDPRDARETAPCPRIKPDPRDPRDRHSTSVWHPGRRHHVVACTWQYCQGVAGPADARHAGVLQMYQCDFTRHGLQ